MGNNSSDALAITIIVIIIILIVAGGCAGGYYKYRMNSCDCGTCDHCSKEQFVNGPPGGLPLNKYNALYTDKIRYTQPMGDLGAQRAAGSGQGTEGNFIPIQGIGAGAHMKSSDQENRVIPGPYPGKIGGQANITLEEMSTRWIGFNNFGLPFDTLGDKDHTSDSYLIEGANQRVSNPGQNAQLPCPGWWPTVKKSGDYCIQSSDIMLTQPDLELLNKIKEEPQWKKVMNN